jgi:hypothetical protein
LNRRASIAADLNRKPLGLKQTLQRLLYGTIVFDYENSLGRDGPGIDPQWGSVWEPIDTMLIWGADLLHRFPRLKLRFPSQSGQAYYHPEHGGYKRDIIDILFTISSMPSPAGSPVKCAMQARASFGQGFPAALPMSNVRAKPIR